MCLLRGREPNVFDVGWGGTGWHGIGVPQPFGEGSMKFIRDGCSKQKESAIHASLCEAFTTVGNCICTNSVIYCGVAQYLLQYMYIVGVFEMLIK